MTVDWRVRAHQWVTERAQPEAVKLGLGLMLAGAVMTKSGGRLLKWIQNGPQSR